MKQYFLGIEFGSTRIKAVLLDEKHAIVKSGDYTWKSSLENGVWTYHMEDVQEGLRTAIKISASCRARFLPWAFPA